MGLLCKNRQLVWETNKETGLSMEAWLPSYFIICIESEFTLSKLSFWKDNIKLIKPRQQLVPWRLSSETSMTDWSFRRSCSFHVNTILRPMYLLWADFKFKLAGRHLKFLIYTFHSVWFGFWLWRINSVIVKTLTPPLYKTMSLSLDSSFVQIIFLFFLIVRILI